MTRLPALLLVSALAAAPALALAQTAPVAPSTPAPNGAAEVNQRINNQQQRINQGTAAGALSQKQVGHDTRADNRVARQSARLQARDPNGQLTTRQTQRLNAELNQNSKAIAHQRAKGAAPVANTTQ